MLIVKRLALRLLFHAKNFHADDDPCIHLYSIHIVYITAEADYCFEFSIFPRTYNIHRARNMSNVCCIYTFIRKGVKHENEFYSLPLYPFDEALCVFC